ncbi:MAG TPA: response regulator transcription factor [Acidimicrobiales bacterium]|nr:response regulator transcription factor [Acidimicrobiales bacterium]
MADPGGLASPPSIVLADGHPPMRRGLRAVLEPEFTVVADVADPASAIAAVDEHRPDLCILDAHLPRQRETISEISRRSDVVLTASVATEDEVFAGIAAGARGFVLKNADPGRIGSILHAVLRGEAALPRFMTTRLLDELQGRQRRRRLPPPFDRVRLTDREWFVLDALGRGLGTADIAAELQITAVTVRTYVSSVVRKLGVTDRAEAAAVVAEPRRQGR